MQKQTYATVLGPRATGSEPTITITTIGLDRDCDQVIPEGGDFAAYMKSPVVLFGHDSRSLPVGATTSLTVTPGRGISACWKWLEGDSFAARVRNAFEQGMLRAASIGFIPTVSEPNDQGGYRFLQWQLVEWSLVPCPANPQAVRSLKGLGLWSDDEPLIELADDEPRIDIVDLSEAELRRLRTRNPLFGDWASGPETIDVDTREFAAAMRVAVRESVADVVGDETRRVLNQMTGRVD